MKKRLILYVLALILICSTIFLLTSCLDTNNSENKSEESDLSSESVEPQESEVSEESEESEVPLYEKYEVKEKSKDGNFYYIVKEHRDNMSGYLSKEYALVTKENEIIYDFDENLYSFEEIASSLYRIRYKDSEKDIKYEELFDGDLNYILTKDDGFNNIVGDNNWLYGINADGVYKVFDTSGEMLSYDFDYLSYFETNEFLGTRIVSKLDGVEHLLILKLDGSHDLFEYDYEKEIEENVEIVFPHLQKFVKAIKENDHDILQEMMFSSTYDNLLLALEKEFPDDIPDEKFHEYRGLDYISLLIKNRDLLSGDVEIKEMVSAYLVENGLSSGMSYVGYDTGWGLDFCPFEMIYNGEGKFIVTFFNGKLE